MLKSHRSRGLLWLGAYLALMTTVVFSMVTVRGCSMARFGTTQARDDWQRWRDVAERQSRGDGPVQRRVRESAEPPALVLMREHFIACTSFALIMSSALFVTLMFTIRGVAKPRDPHHNSHRCDANPP